MDDRRTFTGQSGLSLVELVVAMTILSVATIVALNVYDQARRAYAVGENLAEQQQIARIGYDILATDVRAAGFNINPDGNADRPDEAIEGAFPTALVVRGDFDNGDPVLNVDPEATLTGGPYLTVTTGNDEIRAYVLAKEDGSSSETLTYWADVDGMQRNGTVERVDIPNVALTQDDPPYTLYRVLLENDASATPRRIPMVDNVRRLEFRYYDQAGNELNLDTGAEDLADVRARARIRRVEIVLETLTRDPDVQWVDADDTDPDTRSYRKYELAGDVTPRNVGKVGIKDYQSDLVPPSTPTLAPSLYPGHCGGLFVRWVANPPRDEVAYYRVHYRSLNPLTGVRQRSTGDVWYYLGDLLDGVEYEVAIEAVDAAGNRSGRGPWARRTTNDTSRASKPESTAIVDIGSGFELTWDAVYTNTSSVPGDLEAPKIRDLAGYRVYRSTNPGFTPSAANLYADTDVLPPWPSPSFFDDQLMSCTRYYYQVRAVDTCGRESVSSDEVYADGPPAGAAPEEPRGDFAYFDDGGVMVTWSAVVADVDGNPVTVSNYEVWRSDFTDVGVRPPKPGGYIYHYPLLPGTQTHFFDPISVPADKEIHYIVRAIDGCGSASIWSSRASPVCNFDGLLVFTKPTNGGTYFGPTPVGVGIQGTTASLGDFAEARFTYSHEQAAQADVTEIVAGPATAGTPPTFETIWDAQPSGGFAEGWYRVTAQVVQQDGAGVCIATKTIRVLVDDGI